MVSTVNHHIQESCLEDPTSQMSTKKYHNTTMTTAYGWKLVGQATKLVS